MEEKIEEANFEYVCVYCDKLNLLEKHREIFLKLQECLIGAVKDLNEVREHASGLNDNNNKLQELVENMKKANTNLVIEYEDKLLAKQEEIKERDDAIAGFSDYETLQQEKDSLSARYDKVTRKMEEIIKQNTELTKQKRELEAKVQECEDAGHEKPLLIPPVVVSPQDESFRAKVQADLERKQKDTIEQIKRDFSAKFEELRKSFAMKVEPLDKKKD